MSQFQPSNSHLSILRHRSFCGKIEIDQNRQSDRWGQCMCLSEGEILHDRYQINRELGRGGFGRTYLAQDLNRPGNPRCAVKEISPPGRQGSQVRQAAEHRFEEEAVALDNLGEHPQIPALIERFQDNGNFYLIQEYGIY